VPGGFFVYSRMVARWLELLWGMLMRWIRPLAVTALGAGLLAVSAAWNAGGGDPPAGLLPVSNGSPRWVKGNLHTHSLWSDGNDFPEMIGDWYKRHGYQFLALTEHNLLAEKERWIDARVDETPRGQILGRYLGRFGEPWVERRVTRGRDKKTGSEIDTPQVRLKPFREFRSLLEEAGQFLLIPAEEITHRFAKAPVHMNGINLRDTITPIDGASVEETMKVNIRQVADQSKRSGWPSLAFLNHPNFGWGVRAEDMVLVDELRFFELQNGHPGVGNNGDGTHASSERIWDIVLALRLGKHRLAPLLAMATDDAHQYLDFGKGQTNPGRAWIMARCGILTAETLLKAIHAGDYYCSTGVTLADVRRAGDTLSLKIQPQAGVTYRTRFLVTRKSAPLDGKPVVGKDGKTLPVTMLYDKRVGEVAQESESLEPSYTLQGDELYVRARVDSSQPQVNPAEPGDMERAWTQPLFPARTGVAP